MKKIVTPFNLTGRKLEAKSQRNSKLTMGTLKPSNLPTFQLFNRLTAQSLFRQVFLLTALITALGGSTQAQTTKTLDQPNTTGTHTATQNIIFAPGFTSSGPFHAYISGTAANCVTLLKSPSSNQNYILTSTVRIPGVTDVSQLSSKNTCDVNQVVQYFDGIGRPVQSTGIQASPSGKDIVQAIAYDAMGREAVKYLPYIETSNGGAFRSSAISAQASFYNSPPTGVVTTAYPFSTTVFELSPLGRPTEQGAPGAVWQPLSGSISGSGHTVKNGYATNDSTVRRYTAAAGGATYDRVLGNPSPYYYAAGELIVSISKDENWSSGKSGTVEEHKDKEGRIVLKRVWKDESNALSTYYVYDDLGNLSFVLPPGATPDAALPDQTALDNFGYQYRYDGRRRMIEKRLPGKGWEYVAYNKLDQPVLSQDANQRATNQWTFTKYDALGRAVITGLFTDNTNTTRTSQQTLLNAETAFWEARDGGNDTTGYTSNAYPQGASKFLIVNWYDSYGYPNASAVAASGITASTKTNGLLTGTKIYRTNCTAPLTTANYYDDEARVIQVMAQNHLGGTDRTTSQWSFAGVLEATNRVHIANSATTTIANRYEYDQTGRKLNAFQKINNDAEVKLSALTYNETDQLKDKALHNGLQSTGFTYNERGWLKTSSSTQFSMELNYQDAQNSMTPQYNGNIANQVYTNGSSNTFNYSYDALNRLTSGAATGMSEALTYDDMGNIITLNRNSAGTSTYSYTGNQLTGITGSSVSTATNYVYDANGNATTDGRNNKTISYNLLNLPATVSGGLSYAYDATGKKLTKATGSGNRHYVNGVEYNGSTIELIYTEEGIARKSGGSYIYEYNLKDHLGNTRATVYYNPSTPGIEVLQRDDYYAFGKRNNTVAGSNDNKYLYNGKELQDELGTYDYGWRQYDPVIARWNAIDPLAAKYINITPYAYVANNPIAFIDPDGREIDRASKNEWERQKQSVTDQRDKLQNKMDNLNARAEKKGWSAEKLASKMGDLGERVSSLNGSINNFNILENSSQVYSLSKMGSSDNGGVSYDPSSGKINIAFRGTANFVHEATHAGQFEVGNIAFDSKTGMTLGQDIFDEVGGYKTQYAYDPSSVSGLPSTSVAKSLGGITTNWVQGLAGGTLYGPGGSANTGIGPLNINSTKADYIRAYPNNPVMQSLPDNFILKTSYPNIHYKK